MKVDDIRQMIESEESQCTKCSCLAASRELLATLEEWHRRLYYLRRKDKTPEILDLYLDVASNVKKLREDIRYSMEVEE